MDEQELLEAVASLVRPGGRELACGRPGHPVGHACLTASDAINLSTLVREFSGRYGQLRNLVMGGYVDPTVTERTGLPLLAPFTGQLVEMREWAFGSRWIGCGAVRAEDGEQLVVLVAERAAPLSEAPPEEAPWVAPHLRVTGRDARDAAQPRAEIEAEAGSEPPGGRTWVQRVIGLTGWEPLGISVDWAAIERELEVPLPADYKELCEAFGGGVFSDSVSFLGRDEDVSLDFLTQCRVALPVDQDSGLGSVSVIDPHAIYAPGGKGAGAWGSTEWADEYCWLIDAERPGDYPSLHGPMRAAPGTGTTCPPPNSSTASLSMPISDRSASRGTTSARRSSPAPAALSTAGRSEARGWPSPVRGHDSAVVSHRAP
ncbi:SMI1/KNR4 family protein [Streptomyces sp. Act-28]